MSNPILSITSEKLKQALELVDSSVRDKIRNTWSNVGPAPECPYIGDVIKEIHLLCAEGYRQRGLVAKETVLATVTPVRAKLKPRDYNDILAVAEQLLTGDPYAALPAHTLGVYERRQAQKRKYDLYNGDAEMALIAADAANLSRGSIRSIKIALDEMRIQDSLERPSGWQRYGIPAWNFVVSPSIKWASALIAGAILALLAAYLKGDI